MAAGQIRCAVIGAGGWGTALAHILARRGWPVHLWCREPEVCAEIAVDRTNSTFLPGIRLAEEVAPTLDLSVIAGADLVFLAVPVQHLRHMAGEIKDCLSGEAILINGAKGLEIGSALRPSEILRDVLGRDREVLTLSGPSHAEEVARDLPCALVIAGRKARPARAVQQILNSGTFRVYTASDQIGVEIAGALKNVMALAAGIAEGLGYGDNARAALATRGLAEITHLGEAMGADPRTFSGLAGMGDLIVTLFSEHSRNHWAGREIGRGRSPAEVLASTPMIVEGIPTCRAAVDLAKRYGMEMPIVERVAAILFAGQDPKEAVSSLMRRAPTSEKIPWYKRWRGASLDIPSSGPLAAVRRRYRRSRRK